MKIYIINSQSIDFSHEIFNAGFCDVLVRMYPNLNIEYYGEEKNIECIKKIITNQSKRISFNIIKVKKQKKGKNFFERFIYLLQFYLYSFLLDFKLYLTADKKSEIYYTQSNPFTLFALNILNLLKRQKIFIVMHGELEMFIKAKIYKPISSFYKIIFKFILISKDLKILVLGESIKKNLLKYYPKKSEKIISMQHPFYPVKKIKKNNNLEEDIEISIIGTNVFNEFINVVKKITNSKIKFKVIAKIKGVELDNLVYPFENLNKNLDREVINREIQNSDYIMYLYSEKSYKYMASGAIFDAIANKKPIIYLENDYFNQISFENNKLGYSFKTEEELVFFLNNLSLNKEEYEIFEDNLNNYIKNNNLDEIAKMLKKELQNS